MTRVLLLSPLLLLAFGAGLWLVFAAGVGRPAAAQTPSSADPVQIVRIHNGVYLYWHEPERGGAITGYDIEHRSGTSGNWGSWTDAGFTGTAQPAVVTGLRAGTTYQFRVRAGNASGKGAWSSAPDVDDDPARVVTVAAGGAGVPNTVKSLSAEAGAGSITVTWTAPHARAGAAVSGYTVLWRYYDADDSPHSDSASIAASASSYTISGLVGGRAYDVWMRTHASGKRSRDSMAVYDVTPEGGASGVMPPQTASPTATATPDRGPRVLGAIAPRGGGTVTVTTGETVRLDLDLSDTEGEALTAGALARAPLIGWYIPLDAHAQRRQYEARLAVVFEETFPERQPRAPLAGVAGEPGSVHYTAPADGSGRVVVRAVAAAADCPGGGGPGGPQQAAAWDGPCSAEFTITVRPAVTIAAVSESVAEGESVRFTVSRTGPTASALTVAVSVSESGSTLSGTPPASVMIPAGASAATLDIPTEDDGVREADSVVTATVTAPSGYVAAPPGSDTVTVEDDDPLPATILRYDTYDTTGAVTEPGSYAFLGGEDGSSVVTTYEGLRDGSATRLRIHATDAGGTSRKGFYDTVRPGDLFEWRQADDCWTGYRVTGVNPDPAGAVPRKSLGVERYGYAYTGCDGEIAATAAVEQVWDDPPARGGASLSVPTVYGAFQVVPEGWSYDVDGAIWLGVERDPPAYSADNFVYTEDVAVARTLPYWRDTSLPGWALAWARSGGLTDPAYGYCSKWQKPGVGTVEVCGAYSDIRFGPRPARKASGHVSELHLVNGHPAVVAYLPPGNPNSWAGSGIWIYVYDVAAGAQYHVRSLAPSMGGGNPEDVEAMLVIVRSLFP
jgi:hypothetical protein